MDSANSTNYFLIELHFEGWNRIESNRIEARQSQKKKVVIAEISVNFIGRDLDVDGRGFAERYYTETFGSEEWRWKVVGEKGSDYGSGDPATVSGFQRDFPQSTQSTRIRSSY